jgi:hypothetical protein
MLLKGIPGPCLPGYRGWTALLMFCLIIGPTTIEPVDHDLETSKTRSPNKPFLLTSWFSQVFCDRDGKLTNIVSEKVNPPVNLHINIYDGKLLERFSNITCLSIVLKFTWRSQTPGKFSWNSNVKKCNFYHSLSIWIQRWFGGWGWGGSMAAQCSGVGNKVIDTSVRNKKPGSRPESIYHSSHIQGSWHGLVNTWQREGVIFPVCI